MTPAGLPVRGGEYPDAAGSSIRDPEIPGPPAVPRGRWERPPVLTDASYRRNCYMDVPFWVWAVTVAAIVGMLVFDFVGHVRTPHAPTIRESAIWSAAYVGIAVIFGLLVLVFSGGEFAGE